MQTSDVLKQLEINYGVLLNDLEFASHELDARMKDAARSGFAGEAEKREGTDATFGSHNAVVSALCGAKIGIVPVSPMIGI